jgi:paraquat-inducible protein B
MSEKPHTVAIGAFVVGALLIAISTVIFVLGSGFGIQRNKVVMVFDGSVKGLTVGAPVALRGVQIGQVTDIELILDTDTVEVIMLVEAELRDDNIRRRGKSSVDLTEELISRGMRAQLNTQSLLTGLLYIQLDFHPDTPVNLVDIEAPYLQIPTIPTGLERLTREVEAIDIAKIASDLEATVAGLNTFVTSEGFQAIPDELQDALTSVTTLSEDLRTQLHSTGPRLDKALDGANQTLAHADQELVRISALVQANLEVLEGAISAFREAMQQVDGFVSPDSATTHELNRALREISSAGRALQALAKTLEAQPEALIRGKSGDKP